MPQAFTKKRVNLAETSELKKMLRNRGLHTVCESALCPNIGECFAKKTATFLICGDTCTRRCGFCGVGKGKPKPLDPLEPQKIADAVSSMGIRYIVITSVTRDDLMDGGAAHFSAVTTAVRASNPGIKVEVLVPDFQGSAEAAGTVFASKPDVFSHNIETVPSLYAKARQGSNYHRSLDLLKLSARSGLVTKSGLMLGLGEIRTEVLETMKDIFGTGCSIITLGQYLAPTKTHHAVERHIGDDEFAFYKDAAEKIGFKHCASGRYVRSSYLAEEMLA